MVFSSGILPVASLGDRGAPRIRGRFRGCLNLSAQLLTFPEMGVSYEQIRACYRALDVKHHGVFYVHNAPSIEIIRMLHEVMEAKKHLGDGR